MAETESGAHVFKGDEAGTEEGAENTAEDEGEDGRVAEDKEDVGYAAAEAGDKVDDDDEADKQDGNPQDEDGDGKADGDGQADGDDRADDQLQPSGEETLVVDDDPSGNVENEADGPQDRNEGDDALGNDQESKSSPTHDDVALDEEADVAGDAGGEDVENQGVGDDGAGDDDGGVGADGVVNEGVVDDDVGDEKEGKVNGVPALSDEQKARCRQLFDRHAVQGRLDIKGFKTLFRLMGEVVSSSEAEEMFEEGDKDDNGTIEFDEFSRLYALYSQEEETRKQAMMESIEKLFPSNGDQQLELKKVEQVLMKLQHPGLDLRLSKEKSDLCPADIKSLVRAMDTDGSGKISKQELVDTLCQHV